MNQLIESQSIEFQRKYPSAYAYLLHCHLINEKAVLAQELTHKNIDPRRKRWIEARLLQLEDIN